MAHDGGGPRRRHEDVGVGGAVAVQRGQEEAARQDDLPPARSPACHAPPTRSAAVALLQGAARRTARRRPANESDPITLEPVRPGAHLFLLVSPHGHVPVAYDACVLRTYFEHTHTRVDPVTRREVDDVEMWRLAKATDGAPLVVLSARRAGAEQLEEVRLASERAFEAWWAAALHESDPRRVDVVALPRLARALTDYYQRADWPSLGRRRLGSAPRLP